MTGQDKQHRMSFASVSGKQVEATFDGGILTSDSGVMLLREVESRIGILCRIVEAITDRRHPSYVDHPKANLLTQRVFQVACGYEDANDCNALRSDPGFKAACERLPLTGAHLASQPTMSRFENRITRRDLYRIATAFADVFIASYKHPPKAILLDIDDTEDKVYGSQQLSLFNAYFNGYCYQPLHIYEGQTGKLITTVLRPGRRPTGKEIVSILKRVIAYLRKAWPDVQILLRGDSHFSCPEVHALCDELDVFFIPRTRRQRQAAVFGTALDGPGQSAVCRWGRTRAPVSLLGLSGRHLGFPTPHHLQGRSHPARSQYPIRGHQPEHRTTVIHLQNRVLRTRQDGRLHQKSQDLSPFRSHLLPHLPGQSLPALSPQRRLCVGARPGPGRVARHHVDQRPVQYAAKSHLESRRARL